MKYPQIPLTLFLIGGVLLGDSVTVSLPCLFGATLALSVWALCHERARSLLLLPLLVFVGWTNMAWRMEVLSPLDLRLLAEDRVEIASVRGTIDEPPVQNIIEHDGDIRMRTTARVRVEAVKLGKSPWQPAYGRILTSTDGVLPERYFTGQYVEIEGVLQPPRSALAPGLFDYRAYLRRQGIYHQLQTRSTNQWHVVSLGTNGPLPRFSDRFLSWSQAAMSRGLPVVDEPLRLQWAMVLGWKTALTGEVSEPFMKSGTMHIFAISGLHIALIAGILVALFRVILIPRSWCGVVIIPLIWLYTGATGWQASAIRSTIMMTIIIAGWSLRRPSNLLNSLMAAAFVILMWDPQQLFQASFQLSFLVVLSMSLLMPPSQLGKSISAPAVQLGQSPASSLPLFESSHLLPPSLYAWWMRQIEPEPFLPDDLRPKWQRVLRKVVYFLGAEVSVSVAAWIGSLPVIAYYFNLLTPVSLLANLIVVPLSSLALTCGLGGLMTAGWAPFISELFNHSGWLWMKWMAEVSRWSTTLPCAWWYVPTPPPVVFLVYYCLLLAWVTGMLWIPRWRWVLGAGTAVAIAFGALQWVAVRDTATLNVLPARGAYAIYAELPATPRRWLMDSGNAQTAQFLVRPFVHAQGANELPRILLTHGDIRHVGGASNLVSEFHAGKLYISPARSSSPAYRRLKSDFESQPGMIKTVQMGDAAGPWQIMHPEREDRFSRADDNALVLSGQFHGTRIMLLSDLGRQGQQSLLERHPNLKADIVVASLPSQSEPLTEDLMDAIQPKVVVIADAMFPTAERSKPRMVQRLSRYPCKVLYTRETGAISIRMNNSGWEVGGMDGTRLSIKSMGGNRWDRPRALKPPDAEGDYR